MRLFSRKKKKKIAIFGPETFSPGGVGMADKKKKLPVKKAKKMTSAQVATMLATRGQILRGGFPPKEPKIEHPKPLTEAQKKERLRVENVMKEFNITQEELRRAKPWIDLGDSSRKNIEESINEFRIARPDLKIKMIDMANYDLKHSIGEGIVPATKLREMIKVLRAAEQKEKENN